MKKFKFLCTVVAVVLAVGMFTTTAMAARFTTSTSYDTEGNATVTTTVTDITAEELGSQVTYIAYKDNNFVTADNILFIDQRKVESKDDMVFSYTVPKAEFKGVKVTAIGLGSSATAPSPTADADKVIGGCKVTVARVDNGEIKVAEADATVYPGNTALLSIYPDAGYELYSLTVNGAEVDDIVIGAASYALAVEKDMTVTGTFREIAVNLETEVSDWPEGDPVDSLSKDTVTAFFDGVDDVDLSGIENLDSVAVKSVVGKLVGNPANFENYEFGLRVTYDDNTTEDFPAIQLNEDNAFAVRLIDTTAGQNAFQAVDSVEPYIVKK